MTGIEIAIGYLFAWAMRKVRRVGGQADTEIDRVLDAGMDRLHDLVSRKLGADPALEKLVEEAGAGQDKPSSRTGERVRLALEEAAEHDQGFADTLTKLVKELRGLDPAGTEAGTVYNTISGGTFSGPVVQARDLSNLYFTSQQPPPAAPGANRPADTDGETNAAQG